jgi:hypothetical protein
VVEVTAVEVTVEVTAVEPLELKAAVVPIKRKSLAQTPIRRGVNRWMICE